MQERDVEGFPPTQPGGERDQLRGIIAFESDQRPRRRGISRLGRREPGTARLLAGRDRYHGHARQSDGSFGEAAEHPAIESRATGGPHDNHAGEVAARVLDDAALRVSNQNPRLHGDASPAHRLGGDPGRAARARRAGAPPRTSPRPSPYLESWSARAAHGRGGCRPPPVARMPAPSRGRSTPRREKSVAQTNSNWRLFVFKPCIAVDVSGLSPAEVFARLAAAGLDSTPGTAAEILDDGVRGRISPNKLPAARWVEIIEASHAAGLRSTSTVMFGRIEEPWELAEHMRVVRELQERTGGITEFVP